MILHQISFTLGYEWPDADVDAVITPMLMFGEDLPVGPETPITESVSRALHVFVDSPVLKENGIKADEWHDLMMGCCAVTLSISPDKIDQLPQLIEIANQEFEKTIEEQVLYHNKNDVVSRSICHMM